LKVVMDCLQKVAKRLNQKWGRVDRSLYWGDRLDVRYYLCWKLQSLKNKQVLDIGCGPGIIISELDDSNKKFGVDLADDQIRIADNMDNSARFIKADMSNLPVKNNSIDAVIFATTLSCVKNKDNIIKAIHSSLKEGGELFFTTLNRDFYVYKNDQRQLTFDQTVGLINNYFSIEVLVGFNPFAKFPLFVPNYIADKIPFIWNILLFFAEKKLFYTKSRHIFIKARKLM